MSTHVEELIDQLEKRPKVAQHLPEVREPEVFNAWIRRCLELTSANPKDGLPHVDTAVVIATTSCQVVQCRGVAAAAWRSLGKLDRATWLLEDAFQVSMGCAACEADLLRRRAILHTSAGRKREAISDADRALEAYEGLDNDHDLHGNGLAKAYLTRADVHHHFGLHDSSAQDLAIVLEITDPAVSPTPYGHALLNLGVNLFESGGLDNLLIANRHIRKARKYFGHGKQCEPSRERAHLDWQTAMVRFELRRHSEGRKEVSERPATLRKMMRRALEDFIEIDMPVESSAVAADLALLAFPCRDEVRELIEDTLERIQVRWKSFPAKVHEAYKPIGHAMLNVRAAAYREVRSTAVEGAGTAHEVKEGLRQAIKDLRQTCEDIAGEMLPCLLTWPA